LPLDSVLTEDKDGLVSLFGFYLIMRSKKALVVGAGIAGIASAVRLSRKGYSVEVFETSSYPGGKLSEIQLGPYRFDAGPSLFTLPVMVDDLFRLCGENPADHFSYQALEIICRYYFEDGTVINAWQDKEKFAEEITAKTGEPKENLSRFLMKSKQLYELTSQVFIFKSFHKFNTFLSRDFLKAMVNSHRLHPFTSMHQLIRRYFKEPRVIQIFDRYATYNGSNPFSAPGTLNVIPHLEYNIGAFFPSRGMYDITMSLVKLAERLGVKFHHDAPVEEILAGGLKVSGIKVGGKEMKSDIVISDVDIVAAYRMMQNHNIPQRFLKQERSSSALVFYWGIKGTHEQLDVHNILFTRNYQEEFNHLFKIKKIYHDPTVYIHISSKVVKDDAPVNGENWFTMINVPENIGQDWSPMIEQARGKIIDKITRLTGIDMESLIEEEDILSPELIEKRTSSVGGSLYGTSSNSMFSAFNRHPNFRRNIKNLYFVGGSVHPGGGIPLCLASAKIVSELIGS
jgi:phytoene desaturase